MTDNAAAVTDKDGSIPRSFEFEKYGGKAPAIAAAKAWSRISAQFKVLVCEVVVSRGRELDATRTHSWVSKIAG